jgi:hypothetical protein
LVFYFISSSGEGNSKNYRHCLPPTRSPCSSITTMGALILEPTVPRPSDETFTLMPSRCSKGDPITLSYSYSPHERNATSRSYSRARSALSKPVASSAAFFLCFITLAWLYFRPWSTVLLLDPARYHTTLWRTVNESFPHNLHPKLITSLNWLESPNTTIPAHLFQTDKYAPTAADAETWIRHGFNRTFFNDSQAAQWVEKHFGGSDVARVYRELPLPVMFVFVTTHACDGALRLSPRTQESRHAPISSASSPWGGL